MARKKQETLVLFPEVIRITQKFSDAQFGALIRSVFSYRFAGEVYSGEDMAIDVAFETIASQIDRLREYSEINAKNAAASKAEQWEGESGEMQGNHPPILSTPIPSTPDQDREEAVKPPPRQKFTPPTIQEVQEYCQEKGYTLEAERFVDYYTSIGWKVGKNPMKDWKAALRNWAKKEAPQPAPPEDDHCGYVLAPLEDPWEVAMRERRRLGNCC